MRIVPIFCLLAAAGWLTPASPQAQGQTPTVQEIRGTAEASQLAQDWKTAADAYRQLVVLAPNDQAAWLELGHCATSLKDYSGAIEAFRKAAQLGGRKGLRARLGLSRALTLSGKLDAALHEIDRALEESPQDLRDQFLKEARETADFSDLRKDLRLDSVLSKDRPTVELPPDLPSNQLGWAYWDESWINPDPAIVKNEKARASIASTGLPWRVRDRRYHMEFVLVPAGVYIRGTDERPASKANQPNNLPRHKVTISKPFYLARYELSQMDWNRIMGSERSPTPFEDPLATTLTESVTAAVTDQLIKDSGVGALPGTVKDSINKGVLSSIRDLLKGEDFAVSLRRDSADPWWKTVADKISASVTACIAGGAQPRGEVTLDSVSIAVGDGITRFVHERGCRSAFPKFWRDSRNWIDDEMPQAWEGIQDVLQRTSALGFRLPTEGEWEYACRVAAPPPPTESTDVYLEGVRAVDKPPIPDGLGLFNLLGAAAEFCADYYDPEAYTYVDRVVTDPFVDVPLKVHCAPHHVIRSATAIARSSGCNAVRDMYFGAVGVRLAHSADAATPGVPFVHKSVAEFDAPPTPLAWAKILEEVPDAKVVTDGTLRAAILNSGFPWRVQDKGSGIEFLLVPPGTYKVGHPFDIHHWQVPDESIHVTATDIAFMPPNPARTVTIASPFYLARYESACDLQQSGQFATTRTLDIAASLKRKERMLRSQHLRLPTEVEWEVACRAGTMGHRYGPLEEITWIDCRSSGGCQHIAAEKKPNQLGFYTMIGYLPELCISANDAQERVYRGGECDSEDWRLTSWCVTDETRRPRCGIRVARDP